MTRPNVEVVRRIYEGFSRRDLDAVFELMAPDIDDPTMRAALDA